MGSAGGKTTVVVVSHMRKSLYLVEASRGVPLPLRPKGLVPPPGIPGRQRALLSQRRPLILRTQQLRRQLNNEHNTQIQLQYIYIYMKYYYANFPKQ